MANRREFLQASLAASAFVSLLPASANAVATESNFHTVVFDQRFADSVLFAAQFAEQGIAVHGMTKGDITPFWRNELAALWAEAPVPLAGMTTEGPLFCLEQLGAQYGLRVARREPQVSGLIAWALVPKHLA
jgi:hypothetical protein